MAEHTPTPWVIHGNQVHDATIHTVRIAYCGEVYGAGVGKGGKIESFSIDSDTASANAAFIVRAVNSHEALVKALQDAVCELSACAAQMGCKSGGSVIRARDAARAVIASVSGSTERADG